MLARSFVSLVSRKSAVSANANGANSSRRRISLYAPSSQKVRILKSTTNDPLFNLATEEWIFSEMDVSKPILFLWRNAPTVVIGAYQNPWKECNIQQMENDKVVLARRKSGGGAVYQDLGNFIFTFLNSRKDYSQDRNYDILKRAIAHFGINAQFTGRNDMVVDNRKFSGSAYKLTAERCMHHGTMLVSLDKDAATKYLNVNKEKLKSKGVDSVRQRIVNLSELNPALTYDALSSALVDEFLKTYETSAADVEVLDHAQLESIDKLRKIYEEYNDWNWRFGRTPSFENNFETRFDWGIIDLYVNAEKGKITSVKLFSDTLYPKLVEQVQKSLLGETYDTAGVSRAMARAKTALAGTPAEQHIDQLKEWLIQKL